MGGACRSTRRDEGRESAVSDLSFRGWRGGVNRLARIGVIITNTADEVLRKETLVLFSSDITLLSFVWVGIYAALGLYLSAAIPLTYQLSSVVNIAVFAKGKR